MVSMVTGIVSLAVLVAIVVAFLAIPLSHDPAVRSRK